jgi:TPR repeat protein
MKKILLIVLPILFCCQALYADRNDGVYAYLQGDYQTAYNVMISLANTSDDKLAQYYLGVMYMQGQGVSRDYIVASEWLRKASKQGLASAMYKLAELYSKGQGVPQDIEFAYIWYSVAATHGHQKSIDILESVKSRLSTEELAASKQSVAEYIREFGAK